MEYPSALLFIRIFSVVALGLILQPERVNAEVNLFMGDTIPNLRIPKPTVRFLNSIDTLKDQIKEAGKLSITKPTIKTNYFLNSRPDSMKVTVDSNFQNGFRQKLTKQIKVNPGLSDLNNLKFKDSIQHIEIERTKIVSLKPIFKLIGGQVSYNFNYRSAIDTPFIERDIAQHNVSGSVNVEAAGLPLYITYWGRKSNSNVYRDMFDARVSFNNAGFSSKIKGRVKEELNNYVDLLKDSLNERILGLKQYKLADLDKLYNSVFSRQKLSECYELIHTTGLAYDSDLPDSINLQREDSLRQIADKFLKLYESISAQYLKLKNNVDSLEDIVSRNRQMLQQYRSFLQDPNIDLSSNRELNRQLGKYNLPENSFPSKYRWLMGIKEFSLGRTPVNYSELTVKNVSLNGVNLEYNSWYYAAVAAGTINYQFRDFVKNGSQKSPQRLYLLRLGIGRLERDFFIITGYNGRKHLFGSAQNLMTINGLSAEAKLQVSKSTFIIGEVASSTTVGRLGETVRTDSARLKGFANKNNQAWSVKLSSVLPFTRTRIEAFYKSTGANFQSFSAFQTNAATEAWRIKLEQNLFRRKVKIAGSVRRNDFYNPAVIQGYSSNTIFKSLSADFKFKKLPIVSIAYQPISQLALLGNQVIENRFQTLTASLFYQYRIQQLNTSTTFITNKFINAVSDTVFAHYNSLNNFFSQQFFFEDFSANVGTSYSKNYMYSLVVLECGVSPRINDRISFGFGVKINSLDTESSKVGGYFNASVRVFKNDMIYLNYDRGFLPNLKSSLIASDIGNIQFVKSFNFN